jgi:hypothetical protein
MDTLDQLWADFLSTDPARIRRAWGDLTDDESRAVLDHLARMRDEDGWHPTQRASAVTALKVIRDQAH